MILVCAVALVILVSLTVYTWYKWHMKEIQQAATPNQAASAELAIEMTSHTPHHPQSHFQRGYLNVAGRDSPNLSANGPFADNKTTNGIQDVQVIYISRTQAENEDGPGPWSQGMTKMKKSRIVKTRICERI